MTLVLLALARLFLPFASLFLTTARFFLLTTARFFLLAAAPLFLLAAAAFLLLAAAALFFRLGQRPTSAKQDEPSQ
ncbi:MAG TPA: hypothetical protein VN802_07705 [Stellaceae bacterium]|nr:hypothetical protein [Stellaceae bacterium]